VRDMGSIPSTLTTPIRAAAAGGDSTLTLPDVLEIRGEIVVPQSVFAQWQSAYAQANLTDQTANDNEDGTPATSYTPRQFSNTRNAASGILLRKDIANEETNDSDHSAMLESRDLRSQLRFYAYDIVCLENASLTAADPLSLGRNDGASNRDLLQQWGFDVPMPATVTRVKFNMNVKSNSATANDTWDDDDVDLPLSIEEADVSNMLDYHEALRAHRDADEASKPTTSKRDKTTTADGSELWEWGDFEMDGCVHKIADNTLRRALGNSNRAPRWAVAHKFTPTAVVTELWDVEIQVGRTGSLTPVAVLKPVDVGGVTVQRATMHNFPHMQQILGGVDKILKNSTVLVRRAGDVIPQVVSQVAPGALSIPGTKADDYISLTLPTKCPACGSDVVVEGNKSNAASVGQVLRCGGPPLLCPPRAVAALRHAYARDAFDIAGLSEARIQQLMENGLLRIPADIFEIANDADKLTELSELDGWGPKSAQNVATVAKRVANNGVSLSRFIYSLGIRLCGSRASAQLAGLYGTVKAFLADVDEVSRLANKGQHDDIPLLTFSRLLEECDATKGIGPTLVEALRDFSAQQVLVAAAHQLADSVRVIDDTSLTAIEEETGASEPSACKPLAGLSVVFTGSISKLSRSEAQKLAIQMGAKSTPSTISKSTGLVVSGGREGKKKEQAVKLGVRVISADEFLEIVESFQSN
jgi:NAD-dependent DNA ligase